MSNFQTVLNDALLLNEEEDEDYVMSEKSASSEDEEALTADAPRRNSKLEETQQAQAIALIRNMKDAFSENLLKEKARMFCRVATSADTPKLEESIDSEISKMKFSKRKLPIEGRSAPQIDRKIVEQAVATLDESLRRKQRLVKFAGQQFLVDVEEEETTKETAPTKKTEARKALPKPSVVLDLENILGIKEVTTVAKARADWNIFTQSNAEQKLDLDQNKEDGFLERQKFLATTSRPPRKRRMVYPNG